MFSKPSHTYDNQLQLSLSHSQLIFYLLTWGVHLSQQRHQQQAYVHIFLVNEGMCATETKYKKTLSIFIFILITESMNFDPHPLQNPNFGLSFR